MTKAGVKRPSKRPKSATIGRGDRGLVNMIEFVEYRPNPAAPLIYVNKIGGIYRMDRTLIKACFVNASPGPGGTVQYVEAVNLLWEPNRWAEANEQFKWAVDEFMKGTFHGSMPDDGGGRRPRHQ